MQTRSLGALAALAVTMSFGCGSPSAPTPGVIVGPIQVDSLEIVRTTAASGFGVRVQGIIGDGCTELSPPILQAREGTIVRITILRQRPAEAVCTQIAKLYDQVLDLIGSYPPGRYSVEVNGSHVVFVVP